MDSEASCTNGPDSTEKHMLRLLEVEQSSSCGAKLESSQVVVGSANTQTSAPISSLLGGKRSDRKPLRRDDGWLHISAAAPLFEDHEIWERLRKNPTHALVDSPGMYPAQAARCQVEDRGKIRVRLDRRPRLSGFDKVGPKVKRAQAGISSSRFTDEGRAWLANLEHQHMSGHKQRIVTNEQMKLSQQVVYWTPTKWNH